MSIIKPYTLDLIDNNQYVCVCVCVQFVCVCVCTEIQALMEAFLNA